jgi:hypothetical protein
VSFHWVILLRSFFSGSRESPDVGWGPIRAAADLSTDAKEFTMTLRQTIQAAPAKTNDLITKLSATSNQAVKTREGLFAELAEELGRYLEIEQQHLLPLLRNQPETKDLADEALKGSKDIRSRLAKLAGAPKDDDAFLALLKELDQRFQQHIGSERKELLPALLKALSDEEARELADNMEGAVAAAKKAKRDEKREEANEAKRIAEDEKQAAAANRAEKRAEKAAQRSAQEAAEKVASTIEDTAASVQEGARTATADVARGVEHVVSDARGAATVLSGSTQDVVADLKAVRESSAISVKAASEVRSAWLEWMSKATRANVQASQQLLKCRSVQQLAELQREFVTAAMRNWMESSTKVLQINQRTSKQALAPLDVRLTESA